MFSSADHHGKCSNCKQCFSSRRQFFSPEDNQVARPEEESTAPSASGMADTADSPGNSYSFSTEGTALYAEPAPDIYSFKFRSSGTRVQASTTKTISISNISDRSNEQWRKCRDHYLGS